MSKYSIGKPSIYKDINDLINRVAYGTQNFFQFTYVYVSWCVIPLLLSSCKLRAWGLSLSLSTCMTRACGLTHFTLTNFGFRFRYELFHLHAKFFSLEFPYTGWWGVGEPNGTCIHDKGPYSSFCWPQLVPEGPWGRWYGIRFGWLEIWNGYWIWSEDRRLLPVYRESFPGAVWSSSEWLEDGC